MADIPENPNLFDVVNAARYAGCTNPNIQSLSNMLMINEDEFTTDYFRNMIRYINAIKEEIIDDHVAAQFPGKTAGELTEEERYILWDSFTPEEIEYVLGAHVTAAESSRICFSISPDAEGYPVFCGSMMENTNPRYSISYVSEHGTAPASAGFNGTITEEHLPTLTAEGYVHTGWVSSYRALEQPVYVGETFQFGPILKAVWEEAPAEPEEPAFDTNTFLSGLTMGLCDNVIADITPDDTFSIGYLLGCELRNKM